jgi:hypothetical protein
VTLLVEAESESVQLELLQCMRYEPTNPDRTRRNRTGKRTEWTATPGVTLYIITGRWKRVLTSCTATRTAPAPPHQADT